jgi:hypothetical protein
LLRQTDAKVFKKYSQMRLQMMREALAKMDRHANEGPKGFDTAAPKAVGFETVLIQFQGKCKWDGWSALVISRT